MVLEIRPDSIRRSRDAIQGYKFKSNRKHELYQDTIRID